MRTFGFGVVAAVMMTTLHANVFNAAHAEPPASATETADLRLRWSSGQTWVYRSINAAAEEVGAPGSPPRASRQITVASFEVTDATPQAATVVMTVKSLSLHADLPTGPATYDSNDPADRDAVSPIAPGLRPLTGAKVTLTLDANRKLIAVKGGDEFLVPSKPTAPFAAQILSKQGIDRAFGPVFGLGKPEEKVPIGVTWQHKDVQALAPGVALLATYSHSLGNLEKNIASIITSGKFELPTGANAPKVAVKIGTTKYNRTALWDCARGILKSSADETALDFSIPTQGTEVARRTGVIKLQIELIEESKPASPEKAADAPPK
jgi:hypothetical protein